MAQDLKLKVVLTGDGRQLSGTLRTAEGEVRSFGTATDRAGAKAKHSLSGVGDKAQTVSAHLGKLRSVAVGAGAAIAALPVSVATYVSVVADSVRETDNLSRALNVSAGELQAWQFAAEKVGIQGDKIGDIFKDIQDKIGDFVRTGGGEAADMFEQLGLSAERLIKLSPDQQLIAIGNAVSQLSSQSEKIFFMEAIADDAARLLPLLDDNAVELARLRDEAFATGRALSDIDNQALINLSRSLSDAGSELSGLGRQFAASFAPVLSAAISGFGDLTNGAVLTRQNIDALVDGAVVGFGYYMDHVQRVVTVVSELGIAFTRVASAGTGAMAANAESVVQLIDGPLEALTGVLSSIIDAYGAIYSSAASVADFAGMDETAAMFKRGADAIYHFSGSVRDFNVNADDLRALNDKVNAGLQAQIDALDALKSQGDWSASIRAAIKKEREEIEAALKARQADNEAREHTVESNEALTESQQKAADAEEKKARAIKDTLDPMRKYRREIEVVQRLVERNLLTSTQASQHLANFKKNLENSIKNGVQDGTSAAEITYTRFIERLDDAGSDFFRGLLDDGLDSFGDFTDSVENLFKDLFAELAYQWAKSAIFSDKTVNLNVNSSGGGVTAGGGVGGLDVGSIVKMGKGAYDYFFGGSAAATSYTNSALGQGINSYLASGGQSVTGGVLATGSSAPGYGVLMSAGNGPVAGQAGYGVLASSGNGPVAGAGGTGGATGGAGATAAGMLGTAVSGYAGGYVGGQLGQGITGKHANSNVGATVGTAAGAYIGSIVPVIGTYLGAFLGGAIGSFADVLGGSGREAGVRFHQLPDDPAETGYRMGYDTDPETGYAWYSSGGWDDNNLGRGRTSAFGTYGYLSKEIFEPEDMANFLDGLKLLDDSVSQFLDESEIANIKDDLTGYYYRGDDLPDIIDDRLTIMFKNIDTAFDHELKNLALSSGKTITDSMQNAYDLISKEKLASGNFNIDEGLFATALIDALQIESLGERMGDAVADDMFSRFSETLKKSKNEEQLDASANAITAVVNTILSLNESVKTLNFTFDDTSENAYEAAEAINIAMGGLENLQAAQTAYYQNYFSDQERQENTFTSLKDTLIEYFDALDMAMPQSSAAFRNLVESLDVTTDSGSDAYVALMQVQGQAAQYYKLLEQRQAQVTETERVLSATDPLTLYLQQVADWASDELERVRADYQERIKLAEQQMRIGRELRQYVEQLKISELSPYDPGEKLQLASESFAKLLVRAENGDLDAAGQLQNSAQSYLQNADSYYGRSNAYVAIFNDVTRSLDQLGIELLDGLSGDTVEKLNQQMLSEQRRIREYAAREAAWAAEQVDGLETIADLLEVLPESLSGALERLINGGSSSGAKGSTGGSPSRPGTGSEVPSRPETDAAWADQQVRAIAAGMVDEQELQRVIGNYQQALTGGATRNEAYKNMVDALIEARGVESPWQSVYEYWSARDFALPALGGVDASATENRPSSQIEAFIHTLAAGKVPQQSLDRVSEFFVGLVQEGASFDAAAELALQKIEETTEAGWVEARAHWLKSGGYPSIHGSHEDGLVSVPFDGYRAELHKNERVLTSAEAADYNRFDLEPVINEFRALRAENAKLRSDVVALGKIVAAASETAERQRDAQIRGSRTAMRTPA
ncbi:hypothetical protein BFW38_06465 [Terasakiispira papahanaumokuakeensis]|uniref:Bacteriophage tail tape measure N-terminal domain-containing protein n=2 Tax=Terasakiispira papahanaumokuakeensis TaxID=197479 RepID=A0A1E2V898_9GAMM|nr:hypothetical protein BFW38_06465 [Terasakiispira papahanaumokuakeensis]